MVLVLKSVVMMEVCNCLPAFRNVVKVDSDPLCVVDITGGVFGGRMSVFADLKRTVLQIFN